MSKIDVSKCEFYCEKYDGCYCFNSSKEVYAVNPNEHNSCEANKNCYYRQLQQAKKTIASQKGLITVSGKTQMELLSKIDTLEKEKEFWCNKSVRFEEFVDKLVEEKDKLKAERDLLLNQLVVLDGEDVTVQVTPEQFEEYNKLKAENEELKNKLKSAMTAEEFVKTQKEYTNLDKYKQCLDEIFKNIESIEATAGSIFEDNCITLSRAISKYSRNILQLIRQTKEGENK